VLPNFLVCGIQKGGTTSLYHYLREHPDVFLPVVKEINFFHINYDRGRAWYEAHFAPHTTQRAVGEVSPLYMWYPEVPERIHDLLPEARLIFMLRNPIERAYSNYWFNLSRGQQSSGQSFGEAIHTAHGQRHYLSKGFYLEQIERFLPLFPRERLHFIISEDLQREALSTVAACCRFLGVDDSHQPDTARRHNVTLLPKSDAAKTLYGLGAPLRKVALPLTPKVLRRATKTLRRSAHGLFFAPGKTPPMAEADRAYLRDIFASHNQRLSEFLERDLSAWQ
jgi:Sulfotransferase domain